MKDIQTQARLLISLIAVAGIMFFVRRSVNPSPIFQRQTPALHTIQNLIMLFVAIWILWFTLISIGWARYSFVGLVFALILLSGVVSAVWLAAKLPINTSIYAGLIILTIALGYLVNINSINDATGDKFWRMVDHIETQIPADARILSVDWAIDNFVPQRFMYPSTHTINIITENAFVRHNTAYGFDSLATCPQYIVLGSFQLDSMLLQPVLKITQPKPLFQEGIYQLYEVNPNQLPASCKASP